MPIRLFAITAAGETVVHVHFWQFQGKAAAGILNGDTGSSANKKKPASSGHDHERQSTKHKTVARFAS